ncbi:MAG: MFS transporter [Clostridia bacterium]|nr:MFS transporter [Clostridia bacterium]
MRKSKLKTALYKTFILLFYRNDMQLLTFPGKKDRDFFILQSVFGTMTISLFLGVFLTGLYIYMGASDTIMAYIPILPNLAGIFLVFMGSLTERVKNVRRLVIILNFIGKTFIFAAVWVPLIVSREIAPFVMLPFTFFGLTVNAVMSILINSWFVDTIDSSIRGRYMGVRSVFSLVVSAILPVISGNFLDSSVDKYLAFCIIYSAAWIFSLFESYAFYKITNPPAHEGTRRKIKFGELFSIPMKNKKFRGFLIIQVVFHMFWFLSMTFAAVYEIKYMEISYTYLTVMGSMSAVIQMLLYPLWGKFMDKYGSNLVMRLAMVFFMIHAALYLIMFRTNAHLLIFFLNINGAILNPAWGLSTFNERFSHVPREGRTIYDGFFTTTIAILVLIAPTIANLIRGSVLENGISFIPYMEFKILFFLTFISLMGLNITLLLKSKKETGLEKEKELFANIRKRTGRRR